jgi:hypothetical protein
VSSAFALDLTLSPPLHHRFVRLDSTASISYSQTLSPGTTGMTVQVRLRRALPNTLVGCISMQAAGIVFGLNSAGCLGGSRSLLLSASCLSLTHSFYLSISFSSWRVVGSRVRIGVERDQPDDQLRLHHRHGVDHAPPDAADNGICPALCRRDTGRGVDGCAWDRRDPDRAELRVSGRRGGAVCRDGRPGRLRLDESAV